MRQYHAFALAVALIGWGAAAQAATKDTSPHNARFVTVQAGVRLEVLDWGGSGRPLIFLPGLGDTAHAFDAFAPRFTSRYHVYGITRRGFGASDKPKPAIRNYTADRLGDDVLSVMDALGLARPVLVGHSIAGSELSSVASRHPERVAGLIYLDAAYVYAFYSPEIMPQYLSLTAKKLDEQARQLSQRGISPALAISRIDEIFNSTLPQLQLDLRLTRKYLGNLPVSAESPASDPESAIQSGVQKYASLKVPVLAIYAFPSRMPARVSPQMRADIVAHDAINRQTADLFAARNPLARVVRIPNSEHDIFNSNPAEVERAMNDFLYDLPR